MAASLRFKLPPPLPILLVVCLAVASAAEAQRVAFRINGASPQIGVLDLGTYQSRPVSNDEAQIDALFTSDGRFAVQEVPGGTRVRDMATGAVVVLPVDFRPRLAHPRRAVFFGFTAASELARLDARGMVRWTPCPGVQVVGVFDLDLDGRHLYVSCPSQEIAVLDSETGAEVRRITGTPSGIRVLTINAAGELVVVRATATAFEVARLDPQNGQMLASRPALPTWTRTGSRHSLMEINCTVSPGAPCDFRLVDTSTLATSQVLPAGPLPLVARTFVSPDGREAVFNYAALAGAPASVATWLDVATGAVRVGVVMPPGETIEVNVQYPPLPPLLVSTSVTPGTVSLSWQLPPESPAATAYRLEAGRAPGAAAVSIDLGAATSTTITGVPPGRYYARLRSLNYNGISGASAEIVIDVP